MMFTTNHIPPFIPNTRSIHSIIYPIVLHWIVLIIYLLVMHCFYSEYVTLSQRTKFVLDQNGNVNQSGTLNNNV